MALCTQITFGQYNFTDNASFSTLNYFNESDDFGAADITIGSSDYEETPKLSSLSLHENKKVKESANSYLVPNIGFLFGDNGSNNFNAFCFGLGYYHKLIPAFIGGALYGGIAAKFHRSLQKQISNDFIERYLAVQLGLMYLNNITTNVFWATSLYYQVAFGTLAFGAFEDDLRINSILLHTGLLVALTQTMMIGMTFPLLTRQVRTVEDASGVESESKSTVFGVNKGNPLLIRLFFTLGANYGASGAR